MNRSSMTADHKIDKRHVEATVLFAISNIPQLDKGTLEGFLELVNASGNFGAISSERVIAKMDLIVKYVPGASAYSLRVLAELLDISLPAGRERRSQYTMENMEYQCQSFPTTPFEQQNCFDS